MGRLVGMDDAVRPKASPVQGEVAKPQVLTEGLSAYTDMR